MLLQFARLGSAYMESVMEIKNPRVALLNNGTEETKGGELQLAAYALLKESGLNFIGNAEARDVPGGVCDVLVADGFAGNIVLKLTEGVALNMMDMLKDIFQKNIITKLAAALVMPGLRQMKSRMDYSEYGGAPILGLQRPVIKAHGSSNAKAIKNAVRQAMAFAKAVDAEREV
jgi:glycerol-3-phosphate acyltransferase PlsX